MKVFKGLNKILFGVFFNIISFYVIGNFVLYIFIVKLLIIVIFIYIYECIFWWIFEL